MGIDKQRCQRIKCRKTRGDVECFFKCSKCFVSMYCSKKCAKLDWKYGQHKVICASFSDELCMVNLVNWQMHGKEYTDLSRVFLIHTLREYFEGSEVYVTKWND